MSDPRRPTSWKREAPGRGPSAAAAAETAWWRRHEIAAPRSQPHVRRQEGGRGITASFPSPRRMAAPEPETVKKKDGIFRPGEVSGQAPARRTGMRAEGTGRILLRRGQWADAGESGGWNRSRRSGRGQRDRPAATRRQRKRSSSRCREREAMGGSIPGTVDVMTRFKREKGTTSVQYSAVEREKGGSQTDTAQHRERLVERES